MTNDDLLAVLGRAADAVHDVLAGLDDWGLVSGSESQYRHDVAADAVVLEVLHDAGLRVLSEESQVTAPAAVSGTVGAPAMRNDRDELLVVVDPVDGSTNASAGIPWYATSLCVLDGDGPLVALVANQATSVRHWAVRGGGAWRDGAPIAPSGCRSLSDAFVALSGYPPRHLGWRQFRALGASALDLCAVADGTLDAFVDCSSDAHGAWDYLGALLVLREAGAFVCDVRERELVTREHAARRTPIAAATEPLLQQILAALDG